MSDLDKPCPTCGAQPPDRCVSASGKPTSTHNARIIGVKVSSGNVLRPRKP